MIGDVNLFERGTMSINPGGVAQLVVVDDIAAVLFLADCDLERVAIRYAGQSTFTVITPGYLLPDTVRQRLESMRPAGVLLEYSGELLGKVFAEGKTLSY